MKASCRIRPLLMVIVFLCLFHVPALGEMAGEQRRETYYAGVVPKGPETRDKCEFSIQINDVMFLLSTVQNKYKLVLVKVQNWGVTPIQLSGENDKIEARMPGGTLVRGLLDLSKDDVAFWDSLDLDMKKILTYPNLIEGRKEQSSGGGPRTVYVFAFFPKEMTSKIPDSFLLSIKSLGRPVQIVKPGPKAS